VIIGEGTHVGINATVLPNIIIGKWCTVGAGAVVIKNVPDFAVVVGNPARIVKFNPTNDL
jgi:acetyltransferase EpsM